MNCTVIQDLLILYADDCCSEESKSLVEEHLAGCESCRKALAEMREESRAEAKPVKSSPKSFRRIKDWKASLLQSVLLYASFALIIFGVLREGNTPEGAANGLWAAAILVPVTGFLLSLANWYFIRIYPSRKVFSACSCLATAFFILLGVVWAILHYGSALSNLFSGSALSTSLLLVGCVLSLALCVVSRLCSDRYARLLGKE